jgi:hypothetical protein
MLRGYCFEIRECEESLKAQNRSPFTPNNKKSPTLANIMKLMADVVTPSITVTKHNSFFRKS